MQAQVLVIGAGPVGLTLAAELARYGVKMRILDRAAHRSETSKALVIWCRTLELIDRMGCGAAFVAAGLKATAANITAGANRIAHIPLNPAGTPHHYGLMIPQSETERLLEEHLATLGVRVDRGVELLSFEAGTDMVAARLGYPDGREDAVEAGWLVGCDGAHSAVRHALGMEFRGDTLESDWILADLHLSGLPSKPDEIDLYWHSDGLLAIFPIIGGRYRIIADAGEAQAARRPDPTLADIQAVVERRGPGGVTVTDPIWLSAFRINERKVDDYRAGRVFLAGDAAHVHSPAGGQGMNTGMQDAFNLAWKLALVCRDLVGPEPLLGSYSVERSEVGRQVLENTGRMTSIAVLKGGVAQAIRNHVAALLLGLAPARHAAALALSELSIGYPKSPLSRSGPHLHAGPAAGERAPVFDEANPVGAGSSPRFALFAANDQAATELAARFPALLEPVPRPPFDDRGIWLVRPDGYVATTARAGALAEIGTYLEALAR